MTTPAQLTRNVTRVYSCDACSHKLPVKTYPLDRIVRRCPTCRASRTFTRVEDRP